jgi:hypothetical protein
MNGCMTGVPIACQCVQYRQHCCSDPETTGLVQSFVPPCHYVLLWNLDSASSSARPIIWLSRGVITVQTSP